ncbi:unnamed protein product [Timema podura]|uniref:Rieske domain-containing protein n=1 Tax=Timema podura TaxID=61482 RepID=A0ABN7NEN8_TIMPD|nr:unnamed protein product [Timema podura]
MINIVSKSGNLTPFIKVSTQTVASQIKPLAPAVVVAASKTEIQPAPKQLTVETLSNALPRGQLRLVSGIGVSTHVRLAHTDIQIPDFSEYRRKSVKDPTSRNRESADSRKAFSYLMAGGAAVVTAYGAKAVVTQFVSSMSATADVLALAKIEIKLADIPEGKSVTFKWRGKPLFIRHRTAEEIKGEQSVDISTLRDPQLDSDRVSIPRVAHYHRSDFNGYYCPCHGSHYDASGRIRKGPAPLNLEVPPYEFPEEGLLIVG